MNALDPQQSASPLDEITDEDHRILGKLEKQLRAQPDDAATWTLLGRLLDRPFQYRDRAIEAYEEALKRDANCVQARYWLARQLYREESDLHRAKNLLDRALQIDPKDAACWSLLALVLADLGAAPEECIAKAKQAVALAPDWTHPRIFLAELLLSTEDFDGAEEEVMKGLSYLFRAPPPKNRFEFQFEIAVSGRWYKQNEEEMLALLGRIRRARNH